MKFLTILSLLFSMSVFASANYDLSSECYKEKDKLDRDYCHGKRMKAFRAELKKDKRTWKKSLNAKAKKTKTKRLNSTLAQKQAQIQMLQDEINELNTFKADLAKAKIVKKKRKKKKSKSDVEKALENLNIKL